MENNYNCDQSSQVNNILSTLAVNYPEAGTALVFRSTFELLVAAILSAQCTDKQVNRITAGLFMKYNTPGDFAALSYNQLEAEIKGCGLYRNKSKYIIDAAREIVEKHGGLVPQSRKDLESLPGVGRKTAGVVIGVAYGGNALPVDTHVFRVARRLGLSSARDPAKVEEDLTGCIQPRDRMSMHHWLIAHGRRVCFARKPACGECCLKDFCRYQATGE